MSVYHLLITSELLPCDVLYKFNVFFLILYYTEVIGGGHGFTVFIL